MKRLFIAMVLAGSFTVLTGCGCWDGGCAGYVRPVAVCGSCNTCTTCNSCTTCGYGYGYNDWY